jgi:hypothetical protein
VAAKKVAEENKCLRSLLHHLGVHTQEINEWIRENACTSNKGVSSQQFDTRISGNTCSQARNDTEVERLSGTIRQERDPLWITSLEAQPSAFDQVDRITGTLHPDNRTESLTESPSLENASTADIDSLPSISNPSSAVQKDRESCGDLPAISNTSRDRLSKLTFTPCKLLTHLADNPATDITQILPASDNEPCPENSGDGISCSHAYQLLMRYATTDAKQDAVARVLEEGCVPNADSNGGCKVKNKTISQALLDICL